MARSVTRYNQGSVGGAPRFTGMLSPAFRQDDAFRQVAQSMQQVADDIDTRRKVEIRTETAARVAEFKLRQAENLERLRAESDLQANIDEVFAEQYQQEEDEFLQSLPGEESRQYAKERAPAIRLEMLGKAQVAERNRIEMSTEESLRRAMDQMANQAGARPSGFEARYQEFEELFSGAESNLSERARTTMLSEARAKMAAMAATTQVTQNPQIINDDGFQKFINDELTPSMVQKLKGAAEVEMRRQSNHQAAVKTDILKQARSEIKSIEQMRAENGYADTSHLMDLAALAQEAGDPELAQQISRQVQQIDTRTDVLDSFSTQSPAGKMEMLRQYDEFIRSEDSPGWYIETRSHMERIMNHQNKMLRDGHSYRLAVQQGLAVSVPLDISNPDSIAAREAQSDLIREQFPGSTGYDKEEIQPFTAALDIRNTEQFLAAVKPLQTAPHLRDAVMDAIEDQGGPLVAVKQAAVDLASYDRDAEAAMLLRGAAELEASDLGVDQKREMYRQAATAYEDLFRGPTRALSYKYAQAAIAYKVGQEGIFTEDVLINDSDDEAFTAVLPSQPVEVGDVRVLAPAGMTPTQFEREIDRISSDTEYAKSKLFLKNSSLGRKLPVVDEDLVGMELDVILSDDDEPLAMTERLGEYAIQDLGRNRLVVRDGVRYQLVLDLNSEVE